jgi:hypothetical protein
MPFEDPHIIGKIKWIAGGAKGMQPMDWFDALLHGAPFLLLIIFTTHYLLRKGIKTNV